MSYPRNVSLIIVVVVVVVHIIIIILNLKKNIITIEEKP